MPYLIRHARSGGYEVVKRSDGSVAAHATSLEGARGFIYHAMKGEPKPHFNAGKKREKKK